jgi:biopolymer transport protein ExbB
MEAQPYTPRKGAWCLLALAVWGALILTAPRQSLGQPAGGDQAGPAAAEQGSEPRNVAAEPKMTKTWLQWFFRAAGLIGLLILGLSIYFVSTVGRLFYEMRLQIAIPPEIMGRAEDRLQQHDFKGVFDLLREDGSFISRVLTTGITDLPNGLAEARDAMERVGDAVTVEMEKKISMLAVLGTLGPMIGLLGTLQGMIASFSVIARSDATLNASQVAEGISQALVLTFLGVGLSVPAIYFFALFRNRVQHISVTTMLRADQFLRQFAHAARGSKKATPTAVPGEPAQGAPR